MSGRKSGSYLDVQFQRHGAHVRVEVERGGGTAAQPVGHVLSIWERGAKRHNTNGPLNLGGDVAHPGADHFQDRLGEGTSVIKHPDTYPRPWVTHVHTQQAPSKCSWIPPPRGANVHWELKSHDLGFAFLTLQKILGPRLLFKFNAHPLIPVCSIINH